MAPDDDLKEAFKHMVKNISKSFIIAWYDNISQTNHDFVASCEVLIEDALLRFSQLCATRLDRYKIGQLVASLLHDHILSSDTSERLQSIENQIDNHEYDICQSSVVRLFGLLSNDDLHRVIFTPLPITHELNAQKSGNKSSKQQYFRSSYDESQSKESQTTSALYTLVIAMLTEATFMPIIETISSPKWLYAVIIWLCQKEKRDRANKCSSSQPSTASSEIGVKETPSANGPTNLKTNERSTIVSSLRDVRSVDLEEGVEMISSSINFNNPICDSLKRPIDNIDIYATEEVKGTSSCYVLYCISFDGLYNRHPSAGSNLMIETPDIPIIDKRSARYTRTLNSNEPRPSISSYNSYMPCRKTFRKKMTIKRRFREFVILQLRLEENPKIRPYLKNVPKPTKLKAATQNIFSLPGINNIKLDQSTIKLRQRFLERFLTALNNSPFIANSYEFKEFFSYSVNSGPANISKSKSLILQVNLNKVFVDSVRSAFSLLKASLPGDDNRLSSGSGHDPDAWLTELQQSTMKLHVQTRTSHSKMALERYLDSKLISMSESPFRMNKSSSLGRCIERSGSVFSAHSRGGSLKAHMAKSISLDPTESSPILMSRSSSSNSRNIEESSKSSSTESIYFDALHSLDEQPSPSRAIRVCDSVPIASKFIEIMHYSISGDPNCAKSSISFFARLFLGKIIERKVADLLETAFTMKTAAFCINGITSSIWDDSDDPPLDLEHASLDEAVRQLSELVELNYGDRTFIPNRFLHPLIRSQTKFYLSQLSSEKRNKFVIYSFMVHLLDELESSEEH